jgi:chemosensory pili system protein ChpA (sensor histidine kinase/response regulator)
MKLHDDGDFTALNWVKPALDATLAQARESLEAYVEDPSHLEPMRDCAAQLHQVQGTLRMVELYGAAMVVENMERLAEALIAQTVRQREEAYSVLMRGMVQLPDYLERLQSGHKDIPIVLLPLLNDLRACRGENLLSESALFSPDLHVVLPEAAAGRAELLDAGELRAQALRLRLAYQAALLKWFRDEQASEHLRRLNDVLDRLRTISHGADPRRLWWIAAAAIEAVEDGGLDASVALKLLFGRVDREIHRFASAGEEGFAAAPPRELTKNLLYYVAHSASRGPRSDAVRTAYRLDTLLPTESELQHAQGSMTGRNRNLLGTVSAAIKEDLLRVKEALDIFLRSRSTDTAELAGQVDVLDRVGDTLGMLGLGVPRRVVGEQRDVIGEMAQRLRPIDEGELLDVAGALLYVEASLDDHIDRLGAEDTASPVASDALELPQAEVRKILDALMREASANLQQAKHDIIAFIESPWDHARVAQIPRLLEEISGALRMLGLPDAAELMTAVVRFVEVELITHKRVPTAEQMDKLADALAAIEYYLEATREQRRNREKILDVARESLAALGYWPLSDLPAHDRSDVAATSGSHDLEAAAALAYGIEPAQPEEPGVPAASTTSSLPTLEMLPGDGIGDLVVGEAHTPEPDGHDIAGLRLAETGDDEEPGWTEIEEEIEEEVPVDEALPGGFQAGAGEEIDDDIRDVFIEEVDEEIANLRRQLPVWKSDVDSLDELKPIRRSFHTLKGSGRLVGALALGEFSWKVENLLNRVLDRSVAPGSAVVALVDHAVEAVPVLLGALRGEKAGEANIAGIMDTADRLAAGEEAWVPPRSAATRTVRRKVRRRVAISGRDLPGFSSDIHVADNLSGEPDFSMAPAELIAGPLPNIDPVLFDILQSEVAAHLGAIDDYLARCEPEPVRASEALLRAAHTLNGAIAMVDIPVIGNVLAPLESYVKRLRAAGLAPNAEGLAALRDTTALTRDVMQRLEARDTNLPDSTELAARVMALRDTLPEPETSLPLYEGGVEEAVKVGDVEDHVVADFAAANDADASETGTHDTHEAAPVAAYDATAEFASEENIVLASAFPGEDEKTLVGDIAPPVVTAERDIEVLDTLPPLIDTSAFEATVRDALDHVEAEHVEAGHADETLPAAAEEPFAEETITLSGNDVEAVEYTAFFEEPTHHDTRAPTHAAIEPPAEPEVTELAWLFESAPTREPASEPEPTPLVEPAPVVEPVPSIEARSAIEAEPVRAAQAPLLAGREAAPIADDPQPDGPLNAADADDDLLDIFVQESTDILDHADTLVAGLREAPHDRAFITGLQRDLHTLKGGAHMAGLAPIGDLSHAMESLVDAVGDGRIEIDRGVVESLERGFDRLHVLAQRVARRQAITMPAHAIARFEGLVAGDAAAGSALPREAASAAAPLQETLAAAVPAAAAGQPPAAATPEAAARPAPRHLTALDREETPHAPQEMIRVRSDLLDSLVNYAGEVSIYRSRLEQQISTFRFNLVEFEQTVSRLRDQLRKLEIETEAQIIARYQREQHDTGTGAFDPLELDRFSQLQQLSRALSESVSDLVSIQGLLDDQTRQSETLLLQQSRVSSDLQEGLMRTRMVPFDSLVPNLRRTLRQAAQEVGKLAQLKVDGAHGEMDRNLLERMKAPFEHMLRNALAHGIEKPEDRVAAGKAAEGTVNIAVSREATEVVLRVADDGRGMDRDAIRRQAIERGLLKPDVQLSDRDLYGFVLESGFSTAQQLTQLAGRGVGMDVVHNEIKQLGGSLVIDSTPGRGAAFTIRLPFTLAVTQAILVKLGDNSYAIPMSSVQGVARIARDDLERRFAEGNPKHVYAGEEYAIYDLGQLLGLQRTRGGDETQVPLLMTRSGDQRAAVRIDGVVGSREIVVKSVGPQVSSVPGIFGATIMGDGAVVIILDLAPLVRRLTAQRAHLDAIGETASYFVEEPVPAPETRQKPLVMVVDDSITMRKVTTRVLERADLEVITAKDGLDALEKLQDSVPDLMLLDIEMPRMDGYELATYMRNDPRLRPVPIIMITSRTGEKHRQRALEIGVERYLGKPYQEDDLLRQVQDVLRKDRG